MKTDIEKLEAQVKSTEYAMRKEQISYDIALRKLRLTKDIYYSTLKAYKKMKSLLGEK